MTIEERFERIEHVTAGLAEAYRKDREENRQLWRDTNRQIERLAEESRAADKRLEERSSDSPKNFVPLTNNFRDASNLSSPQLANLLPNNRPASA
jgi:hypothetical protein